MTGEMNIRIGCQRVQGHSVFIRESKALNPVYMEFLVGSDGPCTEATVDSTSENQRSGEEADLHTSSTPHLGPFPTP